MACIILTFRAGLQRMGRKVAPAALRAIRQATRLGYKGLVGDAAFSRWLCAGFGLAAENKAAMKNTMQLWGSCIVAKPIGAMAWDLKNDDRFDQIGWFIFHQQQCFFDIFKSVEGMGHH